MPVPNRPDALGVFEDSRIAEVVGAFQRSRYADAVNRLVERLLFRQEVVRGRGSRGKRREKEAPQQRSNTLRVYLKALERWSYYSVGVWGREIDPREVTTDIAVTYARWMRGEVDGPDIRGMMVRALGSDFAALYEAVSRAGGVYGQVNLIQIVEAMEPAARSRFVRIPVDPREPPDLTEVHRKMGRMIRSFKNIQRLPTSATIRAEEGEIWSKRERNPLTYTYTIIKQEGISTGGVATYLGALSAIWSEMTVRTSEDQAPLAFNPWKSVYARWTLRSRAEKENARLRGEIPVLTTAIVRSMLNAARGPGLEARRDTLSLLLLAGMGLRAEELAGLLRKDLISVDGVLNLAILGKGNKVRQIPLYSDVRDAITLLTGTLEEEAAVTFVNDDGEKELGYNAQYAAALLGADAPLVPSVARWGCNQRDRDAAQDALEPLDVSGVRAMLARIADRSRVKEIATGIVRPLSRCEAECKKLPCRHEMRRVHPHAFRHYAATGAQQAGVPLQDVQEILGHTDIRTTKGYIQVAPQKSMAFTAGVFRTLNRQPAMSVDEIDAMKTKGMNPLEDTLIVEADPADEMPIVGATGVTERGPDGARVIASPRWAYEGGEDLPQYLPLLRGRTQTASSFALANKKLKTNVMQVIAEAKAAGDDATYQAALAQYAEIKARDLWNNFRVGKDSRLPWFAGRANRWKRGEMAPILSYSQIAPEDQEQAALLNSLRALHDTLAETQGPTAANALIQWLTEIAEIASMQFAKVMIERGDTWVLFDDETAVGDTSVVREHAPEPVLNWFETYGWAYRVTMSKSATNRGNIALASMETLPDWFWYPDPLLALPGEERQQLQLWVTGLQGRRKSRVRYLQWVDQFAARIAKWGKDKTAYESASGKTWTRGVAGRQARLTKRLVRMEEDFLLKFPEIGKRPDIAVLAAKPESEVRKTLTSMLAGEGIDPANPSRSELGPAISGRAGYLHPFDPGLLTFDLRSTIVHDDATKRYWYERYGTDSECVVRRAVRSLWETRKASLRSQAPSLVTRHFDVEMSAMIPCPAEMEKRMADRGWAAPKTIDDLVTSCQVMWSGLTDRMRLAQGIPAATKVPQEPVADFWSKEAPEVQQWVESMEIQVPTIMDAPVAETIFARLEATEPLTKWWLGRKEKAALEPEPPAPEAKAMFARLEGTEPLTKWSLGRKAEVSQKPTLAETFAQETPEQAAELDALFEAQMASLGGDESSEDDLPAEVDPAQPTVSAQAEPSVADFDFDALKADQKSKKGAKAETERRRQAEMAASAAQALVKAAVAQGDRIMLEPAIFWQVVDTPETVVFFGLSQGAGGFKSTFLRRARSAIRKFKPTIAWNTRTLQLEFRWRGGTGGLNLHGLLLNDLKSKQTFLEVDLTGVTAFRPNAANVWFDDRPWEPRWPGYPLVDPEDLQTAFVRNLPWPGDDTRKLHAACLSAGCMQTYARWKRNGLSPTEVPDDWEPGPQPPWRTSLGVHPVDLVFAALRST